MPKMFLFTCSAHLSVPLYVHCIWGLSDIFPSLSFIILSAPLLVRFPWVYSVVETGKNSIKDF